jgi:transcriptional regulator GlxA family with amidase domain
MTACRTITTFVYGDANAVDVAGPLQVFATANDHVPGAYATCLATPAGCANVRLSNGLRRSADHMIDGDKWPVHTLMIAAGTGSRRASTDLHIAATPHERDRPTNAVPA